MNSIARGRTRGRPSAESGEVRPRGRRPRAARPARERRASRIRAAPRSGRPILERRRTVRRRGRRNTLRSDVHDVLRSGFSEFRKACDGDLVRGVQHGSPSPPPSSYAPDSRARGPGSADVIGQSRSPAVSEQVDDRTPARSGSAERSGWWIAKWIGPRMSGGPICAITRAVDELDHGVHDRTVGWITTSDALARRRRTGGGPRSTSRALFMSVAEPIGDARAPCLQLGCSSAILGRDVGSNSPSGQLAEGHRRSP